jgi:hypothetical protein
VLLKTRKSFILSIALVLIGASVILLFELGNEYCKIKSNDYKTFCKAFDSPDNDDKFKLIVPIFILLTKIALNILF